MSVKSIKNKLFALLMIIITFIFITPYVWMMTSSFRSNSEIFKYTAPFTWKTFIPQRFTFENFIDIFVNFGFGTNLLNSLMVAVMQMTFTLIISALAGYVFARLKFRGSGILFGFVMLSALIPFEVIMVPMFLVVKNLNLTNTLAGIWLPWIANPFGIFLMRQAFVDLPVELDEAAEVEGANYFQIFFHILLPNTKPSIITLALMSFLWSWNSFLWPLIAISKQEKQLIQVAIAQYTLPQQTPMWGNIFAASALATVPILILFIVLQKYYISGSVMSGMKG